MKYKIAISVIGVLCSWQVMAADSITISEAAPYLDDLLIQPNVLNECKELNGDLSNSLGAELTSAGFTVNKVAHLNTKKGTVLEVKIASMTAGGSFFMGKQTGGTAKATLYKDGAVVKTKVFNRTSGGGVLGAYKGACSILQRITTIFGKDIAQWAK